MSKGKKKSYEPDPVADRAKPRNGYSYIAPRTGYNDMPKPLIVYSEASYYDPRVFQELFNNRLGVVKDNGTIKSNNKTEAEIWADEWSRNILLTDTDINK